MLFYSQPLFLCLFTLFFVNILRTVATNTERVSQLKKEIGRRLREIRESRGEKLQDVADRVKGGKKIGDKGFVSKVENGQSNATLGTFFTLMLVGFRIEFEDLCAYWVSEDKAREREERVARGLMERLLREGPAARTGVLNALKMVQHDIETSHEHTNE